MFESRLSSNRDSHAQEVEQVSNLSRSSDLHQGMEWRQTQEEARDIMIDNLDVWVLHARSIRTAIGLPMWNNYQGKMIVREGVLEALKPLIKGYVREILQEKGMKV